MTLDTVGDVLLWALEQGLGSAWTPQAKVAWSEAYAIVANVMRSGAYGPDLRDRQ